MGLMVTLLIEHFQFVVQEEQVSFAHEALGWSRLEEVPSPRSLRGYGGAGRQPGGKADTTGSSMNEAASVQQGIRSCQGQTQGSVQPSWGRDGEGTSPRSPSYHRDAGESSSWCPLELLDQAQSKGQGS